MDRIIAGKQIPRHDFHAGISLVVQTTPIVDHHAVADIDAVVGVCAVFNNQVVASRHVRLAGE